MLTAFTVKGIHCASCASLIKEIGEERPGVKACRVDQASGKGEIEHDEAFDFDGFAAEVVANGGYVLTKSV
jgi:copper chaperone CopZ